MAKRCFKTVGDKGRVYLPPFICEAAGIGKHDVVQIVGEGEVILLNKAIVTADDPVEMIRGDATRVEKERTKGEQGEF